MIPSQLVRILFALCSVGSAGTVMAQAPAGPLPTAESRTPAAAPAGTPAPAVPPAKAAEPVDPNTEAERKKAEAAARAKKELARKKAERENRCEIKQAMSDAEIARCR